MAKVSRLERKLLDCFSSKNYYEAHQVYRTIYYRMLNQNKWEDLQELLYNGALKLIGVNEPTSAVDLAELYVQVLTKSNTPVSSATLDKFEQLFKRLPAALEKDTAADGQKVDRRSHLLSLGLKWTMMVGDKKRYREKGHPDFHLRVASILWCEGNFFAARNHFLLSDYGGEFASFLIDFQQKCGNDSEEDLFVTLAVLQVLCMRKWRMACELLHKYCEDHPKIHGEPPYKLPLLNFTWLLTLCIQLGKITYFTVLVEQYQKCIERDPSYRAYLDKIGQIYFGVPPPQCSAGGGLLGTLLKGLLSAGKQEGEGEDTSGEGGGDDSGDDDALFHIPKMDEREYMKASGSADTTCRPEKTSQSSKQEAEKTEERVVADDMELD